MQHQTIHGGDPERRAAMRALLNEIQDLVRQERAFKRAGALRHDVGRAHIDSIRKIKTERQAAFHALQGA